MRKIILSLVLSLICLGINAKTVIHAGYLFNTDNGSVEPEMSIIIENERFSEVLEGYISPNPDDNYIDLTGYYVLPGLIDMHVHLTNQSSNRAYLERITLNAADYAIRATKNAEKTLMAGFTTVRNLGDSDSITISLRNAINNGIVIGPRIFSSGKTISSTGGHGDSTNSLNQRLTSDLGPEDGVMNGELDALKSVRYRYKENADLIKITATGGVLSNAKDGQNPQMTLSEIKAVVDAAKDYGFKVAAHAHGSEGMKRAVIATDVGGNPEMMKDGITGFLVEKGNHKQLIEKIKLLLADKKLSEQMGNEGRRFIEETFNWEVATKKFIQILNSHVKK